MGHTFRQIQQTFKIDKIRAVYCVFKNLSTIYSSQNRHQKLLIFLCPTFNYTRLKTVDQLRELCLSLMKAKKESDEKKKLMEEKKKQK